MDIKDYSEKYSEHYESGFRFEPVLVKARRKRILASVNSNTHKNILEIGCGMEPFFRFIDDYDKYIIAEPSKEFCGNASKLAGKNNRIKIIEGFFEEKTEEIDNLKPYDFIIFSSLIHEIPDPLSFLRSIHSLCNENTTVHINAPNMYSFHRLLALEMGLIRDIHEKSGQDKKFQRTGNFDMRTLAEIVNKAGFEITRSGTYFIKTLTNSQYEKAVSQKIIDENIFEGLEKMIKYLPDLGAEMFVNAKIRI